jgi:hypothetical protein
MLTTEKVFWKYERRVDRVLKQYIEKYFERYPVRNLTAAKEFLDGNYGEFIKAVTEIAFEYFCGVELDRELLFKIIDHIQHILGSFFNEIILESLMY